MNQQLLSLRFAVEIQRFNDAFSGIGKDFPGIFWNISGTYSLTWVFIGIMSFVFGNHQIKNASNKDSPRAAL